MYSKGMYDKGEKVQHEFWNAMWMSNICLECGYQANGVTWKKDLLNGPMHVNCIRCTAKWSIAIPEGPCKGRDNILDLLETEQRFYEVRDELADIINKLHSKPYE